MHNKHCSKIFVNLVKILVNSFTLLHDKFLMEVATVKKAIRIGCRLNLEITKNAFAIFSKYQKLKKKKKKRLKKSSS